MKNTVFTGAATAIITPMTETGIDCEALGRLIDFQLEKGIDAIVAAGTTGEGSTLTDREHEELIGFCVKRIAGRVPLIAGTGSNNTAHAIERTVTACRAGADAVLLVTPYYNKTTQRGLIASFSAIADASSVPCILYNVPSRTGLNMLPETLKVLAKHERIAGVKEACGAGHLFRERRPDRSGDEPGRQGRDYHHWEYHARGNGGDVPEVLRGRRCGRRGDSAAAFVPDEPSYDRDQPDSRESGVRRHGVRKIYPSAAPGGNGREEPGEAD